MLLLLTPVSGHGMLGSNCNIYYLRLLVQSTGVGLVSRSFTIPPPVNIMQREI